MNRIVGAKGTYLIFDEIIGQGQYGSVFKAALVHNAVAEEIRTLQDFEEFVQAHSDLQIFMQDTLQIQKDYPEESKVEEKKEAENQPKAANQTFYRLCAIKILDLCRIPSDEVANINSEIEVMGRVQSTFVVSFIEQINLDSMVAIVTNYCNGGDLEQLLPKIKPVGNEHFTRKILAQLTSGLYSMHEQGIAHRDIKLSNIFIHFPSLSTFQEIEACFESEETLSSNDFIVQIGDLGFSKLLNPEDQNSYCGTPLNMAPEILKFEAYDFKIDVWSLGIVMYELLVGNKPFEASNQEDLLNNISQGRYYFPKKQDVTLSCIQFLNLCLQYNVQTRSTLKDLLFHPFIKEEVFGLSNNQGSLESKPSLPPKKIYVSNYSSFEIDGSKFNEGLAQRLLSRSRPKASQPKVNSQGLWEWDEDNHPEPQLLLNCQNQNVVEIQPANTDERFKQSTTEIPFFDSNESPFSRMSLKYMPNIKIGDMEEEEKEGFSPVLDHELSSGGDLLKKRSTNMSSKLMGLKSYATLNQNSKVLSFNQKQSLENETHEKIPLGQPQFQFGKNLKIIAEKFSSHALASFQKQNSQQQEGFTSMINQMSYFKMNSKDDESNYRRPISKNVTHLAIPEAPLVQEESPAQKRRKGSRQNHNNALEFFQIPVHEVIEEEKNNSSSNKIDENKKIESKLSWDIPAINSRIDSDLQIVVHPPQEVENQNIIHRRSNPKQVPENLVEEVKEEEEKDEDPQERFESQDMNEDIMVYQEWPEQDQQQSLEGLPLFETKMKRLIDSNK